MGNEDMNESNSGLPKWLSPVLWVIALGCVFFMGVTIAQRTSKIRDIPWEKKTESEEAGTYADSLISNKSIPAMAQLVQPTKTGVSRSAESDTKQPENVRVKPETYTIEAGDSIFGIATRYGLEPETVLWANYDVLHDDAHNISVGDELIIPPSDGIYVKWKESDQLQRLADKYRVQLEDVLACPTNSFDMADPVVEAGDFVLFPGGYRETQAFNPVVYEYAKDSGVKKSIAGPGGCSWDYRSYGSGSYIWPTANHTMTGNDFWSGHMGVDLGTVEGGPIYAADGGTVIYAGPISGGYGIMVMIDHGTGYQTLYAHLSAVNVSCGQGVSQGQVIGYGGSTGNSTGPHLHFELRYGGGYVNPWTVL